jgi:hypothetical protein
MPIPVTTGDAIASPALTEQIRWRGYGWRGYGWRGYGWRGYGWRGGWGWGGGGALAAGLIAGGLIGAAAAAPYYGYGDPAYTGTRPTTATLTLTVRAITDIDAHSTGHTGVTGARTMRGPIMAGATAAPTMPAHTAGVIAGHIGGEARPTQGGSGRPFFGS